MGFLGVVCAVCIETEYALFVRLLLKREEKKMGNSLEKNFNHWMEHVPLLLLFLAFFILTLCQTGIVLVVGLVGIILCMIGMIQPAVKVDLWILFPLIVYNVMSACSSYAVYGNFVKGFASTQSIFPVMFLLLAYLSAEERILLKRLCAVWMSFIAVMGILEFAADALQGDAGRLGGVFGNPNALGTFLIIGWFAITSCREDEKSDEGLWNRIFSYAEPFLLIALALTLSMGAFLSMAIGLLVMIVLKRCTIFEIAALFARIGFGVGTGLLLYIAGDKTNAPWVCAVMLMYCIVAVCMWNRLEQYLKQNPVMSFSMIGVGALGALGAILMRPNAAATFAERIGMMRNGLRYFFVNPILGVGPQQWRLLNLQDSDKYFNTWHIHNIFIHVGVELGLVALTMLIIIVLRHYRKKEGAAQRSGFTAALVHSLMDTTFLYVAAVPFVMLTAGDDESGKHEVSVKVTRLIFGGFALYFAYNVYCCVM